MRKIITIARQYGSGGREIGKKLSEELNIPFYDKELIEIAAKDSGISKELFSGVDEKATNSFLYSLAVGAYNYGNSLLSIPEISLNDKLFLVTSDVIKRLADEGPCIIVGRCADYVLRNRNDCVNLYIYANMDYRIQRVSSFENLSVEKAKDAIVKSDKRRASYYNYYSSKKWGKPENYSLSIDSSIGPEKAAKVIESYLDIIGD